MNNLENNCSCLSVVIPVYNEEGTLSEIVEKLLQLSHLLEIVIVDDCSTDRTPKVAEQLAATYENVKFTRHAKNGGKTEALRTGFALTRGDIVIVQDADLEYDPSEIPFVIQPILNGHADVVYGSRFLIRKAARVLYFYHFLANKSLTFVSNILTNLNMTDIETGYKAFRGEIIRNLVILSDGFGFEVEVTAKLAKLGCAIYEVPISYYGRTYEEGKKIGFLDGVSAFFLILRFNLFTSLRASFREIPQLREIKTRPVSLGGEAPRRRSGDFLHQ
jgi:glycosyltransferase involved in cell wall biosynthesis